MPFFKDKISLLAVIIIAFILQGCFTNTVLLKNMNVHYIYNPELTPVQPEYYIYHNTDSISTVFVKIPAGQLLFEKKLDNAPLEANFKVHYQLLESFKTNNVIDTGEYEYSFNENYLERDIVISFCFNAMDTANYVLDIVMSDLNRKKGNQQFIYINKSDKNHSQNFLVLDKKSGNPLFHYFVYPGQNIEIRCNNNSHKLYVEHIIDNFSLPNPPFSSNMTKSYKILYDSVWTVQCNDTSAIILNAHGLYRFRKDTTKKTGLVLYQFGEYYPEVKTPEEMIKPLRYITTNREYSQYIMFKNKKEAVDNFWIKTGNINRARELIKIFYTREKYANYYFSCHTEGWQTDRGMIYLILGPPTTIFKNDVSETWIYGSNFQMQSMKFHFNKVNNPLSDNDFELQRSTIYKITWYEAVDSWRNGRAFSISK